MNKAVRFGRTSLLALSSAGVGAVTTTYLRETRVDPVPLVDWAPAPATLAAAATLVGLLAFVVVLAGLAIFAISLRSAEQSDRLYRLARMVLGRNDPAFAAVPGPDDRSPDPPRSPTPTPAPRIVELDEERRRRRHPGDRRARPGGMRRAG